MIAAAEAPALGLLDMPVFGAGVVLLLLYGFLRTRGRDPLGGNPEPEARFGFADVGAVFLLGYLALILCFDLALRAGVEPGSVDLRIIGYAGPVPVALIAAAVYLRRQREHGPRAAGALTGFLCWIASFPVVVAVLLATVAIFTAAGSTLSVLM